MVSPYSDVSLRRDDDEEERRRLAELAAQEAPAPMPARVSAMPLPGATPDYSESMANLLDPMGRRVLSLPGNALSAYNPGWEGEAGRKAMADQFEMDLGRYNATPRNEALFAQVASPPLPAPTGTGPYGYTPGSLTIAEEDALIAAGRLPPISERGTVTRTADIPLTEDGQMFPRVEQVETAQDERALAARQAAQGIEGRTAAKGRPAASRPSFQDNERVLTAIAGGAAPVGQTEPDADGNTYPVLGTVRDVLNRPFRLVQIAPGDIRVYDPSTGQWHDYNADDWSIEGQRRRRTGAV